MQEKVVDVNNAQKHFKELLALVAGGTEVIFSEQSTPVARLVPLEPRAIPRTPGLHAGAIWMSEDFDEPLPEEFWAGDE